jgi:hypothetical protein
MTNKPNFHLLPFNDLLNIIGWSKTMAAYKLKVQKRTLMRWANGQFKTPWRARQWLEELAEYHWFHQMPEGWESEGQDK